MHTTAASTRTRRSLPRRTDPGCLVVRGGRGLAAVVAALIGMGIPAPAPTAGATSESCTASFYDHGTTTASGEPFDVNAMTAAHRTLPFGTIVQVTDTDNGRSVAVRINDRGPYTPGWCIDLTRAAFERLAPASRGVVPVTVTVAAPVASIRELASRILAEQRITLATMHLDPRGDEPPDGASARDNISDTAGGLPARRSSYGRARGGTVALDAAMLTGMLNRASAFEFSVSEIAGGSHSSRSRSAAGLAFDVDTINGRQVLRIGADERRFMDGCRADGATDVRFEGLHIHCGW